MGLGFRVLGLVFRVLGVSGVLSRTYFPRSSKNMEGRFKHAALFFLCGLRIETLSAKLLKLPHAAPDAR